MTGGHRQLEPGGTHDEAIRLSFLRRRAPGGSDAAAADTLFGVSEGPVDVTASVIWSDQTGATLHTETRNVPGQAGGPPQSAEILFVEPKLGMNVSEHALTVRSAFASSLATSGTGPPGRRRRRERVSSRPRRSRTVSISS